MTALPVGVAARPPKAVSRISMGIRRPTSPMQSMTSSTANILPDPAPAVHLTDYGASSIEYTIYCWCTVENYWPAYHSINEKLRDTFAKHNVEMTYDHLNVHILDK